MKVYIDVILLKLNEYFNGINCVFGMKTRTLCIWVHCGFHNVFMRGGVSSSWGPLFNLDRLPFLSNITGAPNLIMRWWKLKECIVTFFYLWNSPSCGDILELDILSFIFIWDLDFVFNAVSAENPIIINSNVATLNKFASFYPLRCVMFS